MSYNSKVADYRLYRDLEQIDEVIVKINDCEEFEKNNIVINPMSYLGNAIYYKLQEQFIVDMIKNGQEKAKIRILSSNKLVRVL